MKKFADAVQKALPSALAERTSFTESMAERSLYAFELTVSGELECPAYGFRVNSNSVEQHQAVMYRLPIFLDYGHQKIQKTYQLIREPFAVRFSLDDLGSDSCLAMDGSNLSKLIPTVFDMRYFLNQMKCSRKSKTLSLAKFRETWNQKQSLMYWRGSTTGGGWSFNSITVSRRVRVCALYHFVQDFDIKLSSVVQAGKDEEKLKEYLIQKDIYSHRVREDVFQGYKYYPDIPGNVLAWGSVLKHVAGCLVFRPDNLRKLRWYQFMSPWVHYIPVDVEFLRLGELLKWANANQEEALLIAWRGHCAASNYLRTSQRIFQSTLIENFEPL